MATSPLTLLTSSSVSDIWCGATVRAPKPWLNEYFQQKYGPNVFETVSVETFDNKDELKSIMDGVDGVIHSVRG
jgi:hypothetical protein